MQSDSPWDDITPESEMKDSPLMDEAPETIPISAGFSTMQNGAMLSGMAEMPPGQMIFLGPPSSAPKVVGIILIIFAALSTLGFLTITGPVIDPLSGEELDYPTSARIVDGISTTLGVIGFGIAGYLLINYKENGVWIAVGVVSAQFVLGVLSTYFGAPDGGLSDLVGDERAFALNVVIQLFCSAMCGLIVAIPLFVSNNGFDNRTVYS
ncbi:hypothetical protein N9M68_04705 [Candidatus Poseidonia alphae]|nr:hypothetical protein [Candidatus Poseidonia alphae]